MACFANGFSNGRLPQWLQAEFTMQTVRHYNVTRLFKRDSLPEFETNRVNARSGNKYCNTTTTTDVTGTATAPHPQCQPIPMTSTILPQIAARSHAQVLAIVEVEDRRGSGGKGKTGNGTEKIEGVEEGC